MVICIRIESKTFESAIVLVVSFYNKLSCVCLEYLVSNARGKIVAENSKPVHWAISAAILGALFLRSIGVTAYDKISYGCSDKGI